MSYTNELNMQEVIIKAKKIGGSLGIIIPEEIVKKEHINVNDTVKIKIERKDDLTFLWGKLKNIKTPTQKIMDIIDEGEEIG